MTVIATAPIFNSVQQCLHFSFLMEILPATQRSFMQAMLEAHMKACGIWEEPKATDRTINFGGMNPLEIRGQCAMVRGAVIHHLPKPEADAVHARYGHQLCKANGVRGLREPTTQECPDGPRYKALGNSWAVPNVRWIGSRIAAHIAMLEAANDNAPDTRRSVLSY